MQWYRLNRPASLHNPYVRARSKSDRRLFALEGEGLAEAIEAISADGGVAAALRVPHLEQTAAQRFAVGYRPVAVESPDEADVQLRPVGDDDTPPEKNDGDDTPPEDPADPAGNDDATADPADATADDQPPAGRRRGNKRGDAAGG